MLDEERRKLVEDNYGFVVYTANSFKNLPLCYEEIVSLCNLGMVKAANSFDNSKGAKFSTYASRCMGNEVLCYIRDSKKHLTNVSLDDTFDLKDGKASFYDIIPDESQSIEDILCNDSVLHDAINTLSDFEKNVIYLTYFTEKKQGEISSMFGFSQSYVSRVIKQAIHKMHTWCNEMGCLN